MDKEVLYNEEYEEVFALFLASLDLYSGGCNGSRLMIQRNYIIDYINNGGTYTIEEMRQYIQLFLPKN